MSAGDVRPLTLTRSDSIVLGTGAETVGDISDFRVSEGRFYILDGPSKRVRVFDTRGQLVSTIGRQGSGPGEFRSPVSIAVLGNELLVADVAVDNALSRFNAQGAFLDRRRYGVVAQASSLATDADMVASMRMLTIADPAKEGWNVVAIANARGDSVGSGCVIDPRYVESRKVDGTLSHFGFGNVSVRGGEVYCTQGISPIVQVMDLTGRPIRQIRTAPPFYLAPKDKKLDLNQKAIFEFLGSFTTNAGYVPVEGGFVSMYTRFNEDEGEVRYHLLVCREGTPMRCGTLENIRKPIYIPSLDSIYLQEEMEPNAPVTIGIYRIAGLTE
ncbi:hypothetical protein HNQ61_001185 [Longimicrobium terrae]|uniref:6-bladed beta-propeller n=1 Tax=Longimicrobium terrae TaxID=1639882 RepID=A0A841GR49_9BACT|nr:6-bladed beta-propeller [Longimicrobium terrae]MBB6069570.1 hypothetical protein [Longimicrobium terrae]